MNKFLKECADELHWAKEYAKQCMKEESEEFSQGVIYGASHVVSQKFHNMLFPQLGIVPIANISITAEDIEWCIGDNKSLTYRRLKEIVESYY